MNFRPCIDLHNGLVKQIVGETLTYEQTVENFVSDNSSVDFATLFKKDGLGGGHIIMLGPNNETAAINALKAYPNGLQIGGGITAKNAQEYLSAGASHVIITSYAFVDGQLSYKRLQTLVDEIGEKRIVLDLSCRKVGDSFYVATDKWKTTSDFELNEGNLSKLSNYCGEFLIHAVDVEGKQQGIQRELTTQLGDWIESGAIDVPVTYAGGISSLADIKLINELGKGKIDYTVGSALDIFGGDLLRYRELVDLNHS